MAKNKQHPVHYLCDVCDFVTDKTYEVLYGVPEEKRFSAYEVVSILNEIARFVIAKEDEVLEEGEANDQE